MGECLDLYYTSILDEMFPASFEFTGFMFPFTCSPV